MNGKRITIYELAKELGISASYVSRALNNHPSVSQKIVDMVKKKAVELNYKHNSHAANLRQGSSKTIGVIVPQINQSFFSEAIAGIEEACFANNHNLIICQSHDTYAEECKAIDTLIHQNVDCIIISISAETQSAEYLQEILNNKIRLIQFDRCLEAVDSYKVLNDNKEASYSAVKNLIDQGYKRIAFIGGPVHIGIYSDRKDGYLKAVKEAQLSIPYDFIVDNVLSKELAVAACKEMLASKEPPDAFFTVSDHQSLGVLQVVESMGYKVPERIGIFGFANEAFTEMIKPTLSSIDQKSKELGKRAANIYFKNLMPGKTEADIEKKKIIKSEILIRQSSMRN
jgi:LacI family transcriptional regulator